MASYVAVDKNGKERHFDREPIRQYFCPNVEEIKEGEEWYCRGKYDQSLPLPKGSIEKLIGRKLTWEDEPVELEEE